MELSIVVPAYNEADNIGVFYEALCQSFSNFNNNYEVIFVDDGSSDNTLHELKKIATKARGGVSS